MFILWQQNHTTGKTEFGPAARSIEVLTEHLDASEDITWKDGPVGWSDSPPEEWRTWNWFSGSSRGGQTTHTAFIRPLEVLED